MITCSDFLYNSFNVWGTVKKDDERSLNTDNKHKTIEYALPSNFPLSRFADENGLKFKKEVIIDNQKFINYTKVIGRIKVSFEFIFENDIPLTLFMVEYNIWN